MKKNIGLILAAIVVIWLVLAFIIYFLFDNWTDRGTFGDMFGAVNALFSGIALAGVIYTIYTSSEKIWPVNILCISLMCELDYIRSDLVGRDSFQHTRQKDFCPLFSDVDGGQRV